MITEPMTSRSDISVVIAGAGIGGLTAALALHARGFAPTVVDSARELKPLGVGINLLPHAVRELHHLGLGDQLAENAVAPTAIAFFDPHGSELFREPRGIEGGYAWPQYSVHRGTLQMLLLDAVRDRLGPDAVRAGAGVTGFSESPDGVVVHTAAGDLAADMLVGADGIGSAVRKQLHPGPDPFLWSGVQMWRGAVRSPAFLDGRTMAIVTSHDGVGLVTYPIGNGLVNWVVQVPESPPGPLAREARWNTRGSVEDVVSHLAGWRVGFLDVDRLVGTSESIFGYPMVDKDPLPHWGSARVTLLGDAAHPMYPVGANGGSQAVVDAAVLADELATHGLDGLPSYESQRRDETAQVIAANRAMHNASGDDAADLARVTSTYRTETARSTRS